ncbi:MAG: molybdopterin-dependent oxidoreductase, partial [Chloroflexi bacterium]|nr:molybdopterin-dependent oxidoreductase [Chloroflexota bacterium]
MLEAAEWSLAVDGEVGTPLTLTFSDVRAMTVVEQMHTLECIGNPVGGRLIGNALWRGVSLRDLLARAAPKSNARFLIMTGADEYYTAVPLELALDERSLLAYEANGEPIPPAHGFPVRVLLPGVYGQKQPKWITSLHLAEVYKQGTWEKKGWSDTAGIRVNSRIESPQGTAGGSAGGEIQISGASFADLSGVKKVEVSTDTGKTWNDATLYPGPTPMVWTIWGWEWKSPEPGRHVLQVRATDGNGNVQS